MRRYQYNTYNSYNRYNREPFQPKVAPDGEEDFSLFFTMLGDMKLSSSATTKTLLTDLDVYRTADKDVTFL